MRWLLGAALLPFLGCGVMCLGGMALAAFGFRRAGRHTPSNHQRDEVGTAIDPASDRLSDAVQVR